ncbi:MAG: DCC1-like thiol-disulfide oxidoreductase family protein [Pseudomonadota bacterium]
MALTLAGKPLSENAFDHTANPAVPDFPNFSAFSVMDAHCAICAKGARWIAHYDASEEFRIITMQSDLGRALLVHYGLNPDDPTSWLFVDRGVAFSSSDAVIRAAQRLGGIWRVLSLGWIIPKPVRDWAYYTVARNRHRWFGRADMCAMPDPKVQARLYPKPS